MSTGPRMINNMISVTSFIGIMSTILGFSSLGTHFLENYEAAVSAILFGGHSGVSHALALIVGGAAVLALTVIAATLRDQEL